MQQGYFSRSWEAFRSTEGWFAKICVLALVAFIPILGPIVVSGYLLGWARDAAWGMDNPLPRKVFGNEDGRLYRRGLFAWIISLVMGLAVFVVVFVCMSLSAWLQASSRRFSTARTPPAFLPFPPR